MVIIDVNLHTVKRDYSTPQRVLDAPNDTLSWYRATLKVRPCYSDLGAQA